MKKIATFTLVNFIIISLLFTGCSFPSDDDDDEKNIETVLISDVNHLPESAFEKDSETSNYTGEVSVYSYELRRTVELTIQDENGNPVSGMIANFAFLNDVMLMSLHDPNNIYSSSIYELDAGREIVSESSLPSTISRVIVTTATIILVITVVKLAATAYIAYKVGEYAYELYDFHKDNFEDISLRTITYRTTVGEIGELLTSTIKIGMSIISISHIVASGGLTVAVPKEKIFEFAMDKAIEGGANKLTENLIIMISKSVIGATVEEIGPNTEVYLKLHYWGTLIPPYENAIEIIPIFSDSTATSELVGTWVGNWNNFTDESSGRGKIVIDTLNGSSFTGRLWDLHYSETLSMPITGTLNGYNIEFEFGDPDVPDRIFSVWGSFAGATMSLNWNSSYGEEGTMNMAKEILARFSVNSIVNSSLSYNTTFFH